MGTPSSPNKVSDFMISHHHDFFDHFGINFNIDGPQLEYFVYTKKTGLDISCSITVNFDGGANQINVMTFYPGLYQFSGTRYFSAVCFFMVMQHFSSFHNIQHDCRICLNTPKLVFDNFYESLKDFDFQIELYGEENRVDIASHFLPISIDTSIILEVKEVLF